MQFALFYPGSEYFRPYQIVTHFFVHANFAHIAFNMFALYTFGSMLELVWHPKKFLFYYFFCAIGAALLHMGYSFYQISHLNGMLQDFATHPKVEQFDAFFSSKTQNYFNDKGQEYIHQLRAICSAGNPDEYVRPTLQMMKQYITGQMNVPAVGASGAIFGVLLAFGMLFPNAELALIFLPMVRFKAKHFIPVLILLELFLGINNFSWDNIAHFAHLGGALFGFVLLQFWGYGKVR
jgi:membrane associated rhomboid family serine protease